MNIFKKINVEILIRALACALVLSAALSLVSFDATCSEIRNNVLRLHIKANSDSESDQALKLKVRDAVLEVSESVFADCQSLGEAYDAADQNLGLFNTVAQNTVYAMGYDYPVSVSVGESWFETREYETFTLPAGTYEAIKINIGDAQGKNWWCVMFPALCVPSATVTPSDSFDEDAEKIVTEPEGYEVRFKAVEVFEKIRHTLCDLFGF